MSELLKNKMLEFEAAPPAGVWEAVSQELEDQPFFAPIARRLSAYEATPPEESWQHILSALPESTHETASQSPLIPMEPEPVPVKNITEPAGSGAPKFIRWIAAAVVSGLLLAGSYYFINSIDRTNEQIAGPGQSHNRKEQLNIPAPVTPRAAVVREPENKSGRLRRSANATQSVSRQLLASHEERPLRSSAVDEADPLDGFSVSISPGKIFSKSGELIQDMSVVNPRNSKYISITAPNGQQTRISAKLAIAMPYLAPADSDMDQVTGNNYSYYWTHLIQEWQEKIMQSGFVPSSLNFLDILEFSELIRD